MRKSHRRALPIVLLAIFLDLICNGIIIPIVPQLFANPDSQYYLLPTGISLSYAYVILGLLIATYPIFMFFSAPILGEYSDYVGRRKIMVLALAGTAFSLGLFAVGIMMRNITMLFISRIIGGIVGGNLSVAQAAIADITPPNKRAARFGLIGAAYGVGFIIGPVIGGLLADSSLVSWFSASTPFWFAAVLSLINAVLVYFYLAETRAKYQPVSFSLSLKTNNNGDGNTISLHKAIFNILRAYKMTRVRSVFATNFLFQSGIALFATFFSVFLIYNFSWNQVSIGYYIGYVGIWVIVSQAILLRFLTKKHDEVTLLRIFLIVGSIAIFSYCIPNHTIGLLIAGAFFALTNGISMATLPSLASRRASAENQGEIMGINASVQALAQTTPPILAGFLTAQISTTAPVYIGGAIIGLAWLVFVIFVKRE
jgi:MFS transporter, DHA1 family, tetracycline resistance protein